MKLLCRTKIRKVDAKLPVGHWLVGLLFWIITIIIIISSRTYGGPQLSHQNQMLTANYKSLTGNSNRSQQIQIVQSNFKFKSPFCRGSRVFCPYFTKGKPNYQIILMYIMYGGFPFNCASSILVSVVAGSSVVTQRGTFHIFLHECTHFLSVSIPIACGQIFLHLKKKKDALSMMGHFSVCDNKRVSEGLHGLAVSSHDSLTVRFFDIRSLSFRDLPLLYDIIGCFK